MRFLNRPSAYRPQFGGSPFGRRFSGLLPWMFVVGIALAVVLTFRHGTMWPVPHADGERRRDAEIVLRQAGRPDSREAVDVIRTIDGDTFLARLHQRDGRDLVVRVRLRGIDAPELKASCQEELDKAEAAARALRDLLGQGGVTITNLDPTNMAAFSPTLRPGEPPTFRRRCSPAVTRGATMVAIATAGARAAGVSGNKKAASDDAALVVCPVLFDQRVTTTVVPTETRP